MEDKNIFCSNCSTQIKEVFIQYEKLFSFPLCLPCLELHCSRCRVPLTSEIQSEKDCQASCGQKYCLNCQTDECNSCNGEYCFYCGGSQLEIECFDEGEKDDYHGDIVCVSCLFDNSGKRKFSFLKDQLVCCHPDLPEVSFNQIIRKFKLDFEPSLDDLSLSIIGCGFSHPN